MLDYLFTNTLNNLIASYCNESIDRVVNGVLIASLECNRVGCFHNTQSEINYILFMINFCCKLIISNLLGSPDASISFCMSCSNCDPDCDPLPETTVRWYNQESCNQKNI